MVSFDQAKYEILALQEKFTKDQLSKSDMETIDVCIKRICYAKGKNHTEVMKSLDKNLLIEKLKEMQNDPTILDDLAKINLI